MHALCVSKTWITDTFELFCFGALGDLVKINDIMNSDKYQEILTQNPNDDPQINTEIVLQ